VTEELRNSSNIVTFAELHELLGPPPVLSTENVSAYNEILARLMQCMTAGDFMEQLLIRDIADATWEARRATRHMTLAIERKFRQERAFKAKRLQSKAQQQAEPMQRPAPADGKPMLAHMDDLEDFVVGTVSAVDEILERPAEERDHARAMQNVIDYYLRLNQLLNSALARRDLALEQLERYQRGASRRLRKASDDIIDAQCNEGASQAEDTPPLALTHEAAQ
jgi:hypothetical protein